MTDSGPLISICIPAYNRAEYLCEAIESVIGQQEEDTEIIVVDDGSTDDTRDVALSFDRSKVSYIHKDHTNAPDTANRCMKEAKGRFVLWLDSDDILPDGSTKRFRETLGNFPDVDVFYGDLQPFGDVGTIQGKKIACLDYHKKNSALLARMVYSNRIPLSGTFIQKDLFLRIGTFNPGFNRSHDYEFFVRAVNFAAFKHVGGVSIHWRWHENNLSRNKPPGGYPYEASIVRWMVAQYPLSMLFPGFPWNEPRRAGLMANSELAMIFLARRDPESAISNLEKGFFCVNPGRALPCGRKARLEAIRENYIRMHENTGEKYFQKVADMVNGLSGRSPVQWVDPAKERANLTIH